MTLAIAVQYPYGRLREALESLSSVRPLRRKEAIIFLTDSRYTYPNHYEDDGIKLHDIDISTVVAFSGKVNIAEQCVENLQRKLSSPGNKIINVQKTFQRTYKFHKSHNDKIGVKTGILAFLMGKYLKTGETRLILLESPDFKAKFVTGIECVGEREAYEEIKKTVVPQLQDLSNYDGTEKDYFKIAVIIAGAMRTLAIENPRFDTIAGLIQYWVLDRKGITEYQLSYIEDPTGKKDQWHRVTAKRNELKTAKDKHDLGHDYLMG